MINIMDRLHKSNMMQQSVVICINLLSFRQCQNKSPTLESQNKNQFRSKRRTLIQEKFVPRALAILAMLAICSSTHAFSGVGVVSNQHYSGAKISSQINDFKSVLFYTKQPQTTRIHSSLSMVAKNTNTHGQGQGQVQSQSQSQSQGQGRNVDRKAMKKNKGKIKPMKDMQHNSSKKSQQTKAIASLTKKKKIIKAEIHEPKPLKKRRKKVTIPTNKMKIDVPISSESQPLTNDELRSKSKSRNYVQKEAIDFLLNDDDDDDDDDDNEMYHNMERRRNSNDLTPEDDEANQIADKSNFSRLSDEAKFKATMALKMKPNTSASIVSTTSISQPYTKTKVRASVKETGNDTMSHYLKSIGNHELLRKEDEIVLGRQIQIFVKWEEVRLNLEEQLMRTPTFSEWANELQTTVPELKKQIRRSQRAKAALIEANLRLVINIARQSMKSGKTEISFQDACQEGIIGLTKACEKYDPEKGFRFSTYANWYIKRSVNENVIDQSRTVKLPYRVAMKINQIQITEVTLKDELGRKPTDQEIADKLEITVENLEFFRQKSHKAFSLDKSVSSKGGKGSSASSGGNGDGSNGGLTITDTIRDPSSEPTELISKQMLRDDVRRLITTLSPREQAVIRLRFGVDDEKPRTVDYIANKFNVSKEKIKKVETRALLKLKQPFRSNAVKCYISDI